MIPKPESRRVFSTEPQPAPRTEHRAPSRFTIHNLALAAHLAAVGHEVTTHIGSHGFYWSTPVAAQEDEQRFRITLAAFNRVVKQHRRRAAAPTETTDDAPQPNR